MESRLSDLFFQNSISFKGFGCPYLRAYSGSNFKMFLIYFVHMMTHPSKV